MQKCDIYLFTREIIYQCERTHVIYSHILFHYLNKITLIIYPIYYYVLILIMLIIDLCYIDLNVNGSNPTHHFCMHAICFLFTHTQTGPIMQKDAPNPANQRAAHASSGECVNTVESSVDLYVHLSLCRHYSTAKAPIRLHTHTHKGSKQGYVLLSRVI